MVLNSSSGLGGAPSGGGNNTGGGHHNTGVAYLQENAAGSFDEIDPPPTVPGTNLTQEQLASLTPPQFVAAMELLNTRLYQVEQ